MAVSPPHLKKNFAEPFRYTIISIGFVGNLGIRKKSVPDFSSSQFLRGKGDMKTNHIFFSKRQKITLSFIIVFFLFTLQAWGANRTVLAEVFSYTT